MTGSPEPDTDVWERRPDESDPAWQGLETFREQPPGENPLDEIQAAHRPIGTGHRSRNTRPSLTRVDTRAGMSGCASARPTSAIATQIGASPALLYWRTVTPCAANTGTTRAPW